MPFEKHEMGQALPWGRRPLRQGLGCSGHLEMLAVPRRPAQEPHRVSRRNDLEFQARWGGPPDGWNVRKRGCLRGEMGEAGPLRSRLGGRGMWPDCSRKQPDTPPGQPQGPRTRQGRAAGSPVSPLLRLERRAHTLCVLGTHWAPAVLQMAPLGRARVSGHCSGAPVPGAILWVPR